MLVENGPQKGKKRSCAGGIRDCGGPIEGAEEGHEKSSIVSAGARSDVFHLWARLQLFKASPLKSFLQCGVSRSIGGDGQMLAYAPSKDFPRREVLAKSFGVCAGKTNVDNTLDIANCVL